MMCSLPQTQQSASSGVFTPLRAQLAPVMRQFAPPSTSYAGSVQQQQGGVYYGGSMSSASSTYSHPYHQPPPIGTQRMAAGGSDLTNASSYQPSLSRAVSTSTLVTGQCSPFAAVVDCRPGQHDHQLVDVQPGRALV